MKFVRLIAGNAPGIVLTGVGVVGVCAITYGVAMMYEPAGYIVGGGFALAAALMLDR